MKRIMIAAALALTATLLAAPAQARDTTWACPTCIAMHR